MFLETEDDLPQQSGGNNKHIFETTISVRKCAKSHILRIIYTIPNMFCAISANCVTGCNWKNMTHKIILKYMEVKPPTVLEYLLSRNS